MFALFNQKGIIPSWLKSARISFVSEMLGLGLYIAGLVHMLQYH